MAQQVTVKGEEQRRTKIFREFKGVVNNSARNQLPEDAWFYLENMQPIGDANVQGVSNISAVLHDYTGNTIYWADSANVGGDDYIIIFATNGNGFAYQIRTQTNFFLGTFSGSGSRIAQWKNTTLLIIDSTGYYSWTAPGPPAALISGVGVPTNGTDIAVAFGRVWILQGRLITFSGANDFTAASFLVANGAGSLALTDPTIRNVVTRLKALNGYLYIISPTGINAISDVYVPASASPPTPLFTNLNIQAIIGCDQPGSVFAMNQALVFANRYGIYFLYGTNAKKVSIAIDGTWKYLDFTQGISGGQVVSNNIICSAMLVKRLNDPVFGSNTVLAMYHDTVDQWWFGNFGALTFVVSSIVNNTPALFGFIANKLYQLFADTTTAPATLLMTPLWGMEDPLADKAVIRAGFEVSVSLFSGTFTMSIDTVNSSSQAVTLNTAGNVAWINNALNTVLWQNNLLVIVSWFTGTYILYNATAPGVFGKYVGATIAASASLYQFSAVDMDYKLGARWQ